MYAVTRWLPFVVDAISFAIACFDRQPDPYRPLRAAPAPRAAAPPAHRGIRLHVGAAVLPDADWSGRRMTNLVTNAIFFVVVLRMVQEGVPAAQIGLVSTAAGIGGLLGAALAPSLIHRMPTGRPDGRDRMDVLPAAGAARLCRPARRWRAPAPSSCCCSTRSATPASAPTGWRSLPTTCRDASARRASSRRCRSCRWRHCSAAGCSSTSGGTTAITVLVVASALLAVLLTTSRSIRSVPKPSEWDRAPAQRPAEPVLTRLQPFSRQRPG